MDKRNRGLVDNSEAKRLVKRAFNYLTAAKTAESTREIPEKLGIAKKFKYSTKKYPDIDFSISKKDIEKLKKENKITDENDIGEIPSQDVFAKLLYAVLWKQGDLQKVRHIIEGICHEQGMGNAITFHQFGCHLANAADEPIIDQHVIRAYQVYRSLNKPDDVVDKLIRKSSLGIADKKVVEDYKSWINKLCRGDQQFQKAIDFVLYAVGKSIKLKKGNH